MGGYGSGGSNRKKSYIEQFRRIDSYSDVLNRFGNKKNQSGAAERKYYSCPVCHRRVRYLYEYKQNQYACRMCLNCNYRSQQMGRDDLAIERAKKILLELGVEIQDMTPWDFMQLNRIDKPKGMETEKYEILFDAYCKQQKIWYGYLMKAAGLK